MPHRRSSGQRRRRKPRRVKIVRYVVPTTRRATADHPMALTVPTRWVKNIIALFLLPWCAVLTQTFFTALQRARDRSLRDREFILQRCSLWPTALRDARYYLGLSSHLYLLDDSEEPDRSERSRDIFFSRFYLCDEPGAFKRLARDRIAANYLCQFWRRFGRKFAQFFGMGRQFHESVYAGSWRAGELAESMRQRMSLWLRGAQAACLRCLAALPNTTSSASCRRLQAGSLRSPDKTV